MELKKEDLLVQCLNILLLLNSKKYCFSIPKFPLKIINDFVFVDVDY